MSTRAEPQTTSRRRVSYALASLVVITILSFTIWSLTREPQDLFAVLSGTAFSESEEPEGFDFEGFSSHKETKLIYATFNGPDDRNRFVYSIETNASSASRAYRDALAAYKKQELAGPQFPGDHIRIIEGINGSEGRPSFCVSSPLFGVECSTVEESVVIRGDSSRRTRKGYVGNIGNASTLLRAGVLHLRRVAP